MTLEHRFVVGLKDIRAVVCECKNCLARLSLKPDALQAMLRSDRLIQCPSCYHPWLTGRTNPGQMYRSELVMFLSVLAPCIEIQEDNTTGVRILFEIDEPSTPGAPLATAP